MPTASERNDIEVLTEDTTRRGFVSSDYLVTSSMNPDPLESSDSAAEFLGVKPGTLAVWRCTGRYDLPFVKIGSRVFYKRSVLLGFIEKRTRHQTGIAA